MTSLQDLPSLAEIADGIRRYIAEPVLVPLLGGPTFHAPTAQIYFETCLVLLLLPGLALFLRQNVLSYILPKRNLSAAERMVSAQRKPPKVATFQLLYLPVFWLLRTAFWMSGPYFVPAYASKMLASSDDGDDQQPSPIPFSMITQIFHVGFGSAALLLPIIASLVSRGYTDEKSGTIAAAVFYGLGAASVAINWSSSGGDGEGDDITNGNAAALVTTPAILFAGRALGSIGTGLLNVMPEAWISSEVQKSGADPYGRWLSATFATAYAFDGIVAIGAGQLASWVADACGDETGPDPTAPFRWSPMFLLYAVIVVALLWTDTDVPVKKVDGGGAKQEEEGNGLSLGGAINVILSDSKIVMVGLVQCLFEASTYIFVLNQAPAVKAATVEYFGGSGSDDGVVHNIVVPSGIVFSCYMACCLLGSSIYGHLTERSKVRPERIMTVVLIVAAASLVCSGIIIAGDDLALGSGLDLGLTELMAAFFVFEVCAGIYYPSISSLRSKYLPVKHRSVIMTIVTVPFNLLVLAISLSTSTIGVTGAWLTASVLILAATACLLNLQRIARREAIENLLRTWKRVRAKWVSIARVMQIRKLVQGIAKQAEKEGVE